MGKKKFYLVGNLRSSGFQHAKDIIEKLAVDQEKAVEIAEILPIPPVQWPFWFEKKVRENQNEHLQYYNQKPERDVMVYTDEEFLGDEVDLVAFVRAQYGFKVPQKDYSNDAEDAFKQYLKDTGHVFCYLDIKLPKQPASKIVFELYNDLCPKTCENFRSLCEGKQSLKYAGSPIHRVAKDAWIQGGDVCGGKGDGGESIYGPVFEDENFIVKHDEPYILGLSNTGRHTNNSQFYVTLKPMESFDRKFIAFGRVVDGVQALEALNSVELLLSGRPKDECMVESAGQFNI